jgi:hypothetical protein
VKHETRFVATQDATVEEWVMEWEPDMRRFEEEVEAHSIAGVARDIWGRADSAREALAHIVRWRTRGMSDYVLLPVRYDDIVAALEKNFPGYR